MTSAPVCTGGPRISSRTVRGWREPGKVIKSFTHLGGAFERATGRFPFALPQSWLDRQKQLDASVPFNFVTDNDIIGGNSGSPLINKNGEIVGLIFDGNRDSLGGDYGYDGSNNRAVAVHGTALIEGLQKVYGADRVVSEIRSRPEPGGHGSN